MKHLSKRRFVSLSLYVPLDLRAPTFGRTALESCCALLIVAILLSGCQLGSPTPVPTATPGPAPVTPTPTLTPTLSAAEMGLFPAYAHGELLPHMQVPIQRSATGEGGWYVVIGTEEGWAQFLSEMGQPAEIWEPVQWQDEILVGALLGVRQGRGHAINIRRLDLDGVTAELDLEVEQPGPEQAASNWITYPFHLIRVPRAELALGVVTFRFLVDGETVAERDVDIIDLDIAWISGPAATYPTPTPVPTTVPVPTATSTPVPSLKVAGTLLEVQADAMRLRIVPVEGDWEIIELMEGTSIFEGGRPVTLNDLAPGSAISALGYAQEGPPDAGRTMRAAHIDLLAPAPESLAFARYRPNSVSLSTIYDGYKLPLDAGQISSTLPLSASLNVTQTAALARNGFVVVPASYPSFSALYAVDSAETAETAVLVTADSVLHVTQLTMQHVWRAVERQRLARELSLLDREMFDLCWTQYQAVLESERSATAVPGVAAEQVELTETALRSAAYFAVAVSLQHPGFEVPDALAPLVQAELALISDAADLAPSPLLALPGVPAANRQRLDYRAFDLARQVNPLDPTPGRGPDDAHAGYLRALTWHRQVALRPDQKAETRIAALIAHTLHANTATRVLWERLHALLAYAQGRDASYTAPEYAALIAQVETDAGLALSPAGYVDEEEWSAVRSGIQGLALPDHPIWTVWADKHPIERQWRLFGLPFRAQEYVFEQTTSPNVGTPDAPRLFPSGIDLSAALGSLEAYPIATQLGYSEWTGYVDQVDAVRDELSAMPRENWTQSLHWNWLYVYRSLLGEKNASYPAWMRTTAAERRAIQAQHGSWTHVLRQAPVTEQGLVLESQDSVLPLPTPEGTWGYVEPQPEVYGRLAAMVRQVLDGLEARLMLEGDQGDQGREQLLKLEEWLLFFQDAARRELVSPSLAQTEYARLGQWGAYVAEVTLAAVQDAGLDETAYSEAVVVPLIGTGSGVDALTLVQATGTIDEIYCVIERGRELYLARGGVYAHYELTWPSALPLNETIWRERLVSASRGSATFEPGEEPYPVDVLPRPEWVAGYVVGEDE